MSDRSWAIGRALLEELQGEAGGEVERCGLLLARPESDRLEAHLAYPGPLYPRRFEMSPEWMLEAFVRQRSCGWEVAGFYHTHPTGEALRPSPADLAGHPFGALVMLVGPVDWRAFRVGEGDWRELSLRELPASARVFSSEGQ